MDAIERVEYLYHMRRMIAYLARDGWTDNSETEDIKKAIRLLLRRLRELKKT